MINALTMHNHLQADQKNAQIDDHNNNVQLVLNQGGHDYH